MYNWQDQKIGVHRIVNCREFMVFPSNFSNKCIVYFGYVILLTNYCSNFIQIIVQTSDLKFRLTNNYNYESTALFEPLIYSLSF